MGQGKREGHHEEEDEHGHRANCGDEERPTLAQLPEGTCGVLDWMREASRRAGDSPGSRSGFRIFRSGASNEPRDQQAGNCRPERQTSRRAHELDHLEAEVL